MVDSTLQQIIISLIVLFLMGYVAYNIYLIELYNMFNGENNIRREVDIIEGVYDFNSNKEWKYNTNNKMHNNYLPIKSSINQQGGAEYSYNFWLYVNKEKLEKYNNENKDIALLLKGEKIFYYNVNNYNCSARSVNETIIPTLLTKNPLIRINHNGSKLAVDYNNILSPDSYQYNSSYKECSQIQVYDKWEEKNRNLLGIWDIPFDGKWFMVSIVMKEVADSANILSVNRAMCKIYMNGMLVFDDKVETKYGVELNNIYSATHKDNKSPLYINPELTNIISRDANGVNLDQFFDTTKIGEENVLKMGDVKYFNYAINKDIINGIYNKGLNKVKSVKKVKVAVDYNKMVSFNELEESSIKKL